MATCQLMMASQKIRKVKVIIMDKRLTFEELEDGKDYIAIGDNGKEYEAKAKLFENIGMILFCVYPADVELIAYKEA